MDEACYLCRRTQTELDHLNEELRARVYLQYFTNAHGQIDEQRRKITFLQRLKDEEGADPHFRIGAAQVFGDPPAYQKLMPWIGTLMAIASPEGGSVAGTIGELVESLLVRERATIVRMEKGLDQIREGFGHGGKTPFTLHPVTVAFPVDWSVDPALTAWRREPTGTPEPLRRVPGTAQNTVDAPLRICSVCRWLTGTK